MVLSAKLKVISLFNGKYAKNPCSLIVEYSTSSMGL